MRKLVLLIILLEIWVNAGCSYFLKQTTSTLKDSSPEHTSLQKVELFALEEIKKGGKLLFVPFTAGIEVAATEEMERVALKIVKGTATILEDAGSFWEILGAEKASTSDYIIKGHIVEMEKESPLRKWFSSKKKVLRVEGRMINANTQEVIFIFAHMKETTNKKESFDELGLGLGKDLGEFLLSY